MILTSKFIYILNSKTATTSVERTFQQLNTAITKNWPSYKRIIFKFAVRAGLTSLPSRTLLITGSSGNRTKHGNVTDIPATHAHLPIVACLRPLPDYILSHIHYGDSELWFERLKGHKPKQQLSIENSLDVYKSASKSLCQSAGIRKEIGFFSFWLIKNFTSNFEDAVENINAGELQKVTEDLGRVRFFSFENQLIELKRFLQEMDFYSQYASAVDTKTHVNRSTKRVVTDADLARLGNYILENESIYSDFYSKQFPNP